MPGGRISARAVLACLCLGALVSTARGQALDKVTMGITGTSSDVARRTASAGLDGLAWRAGGIRRYLDGSACLRRDL